MFTFACTLVELKTNTTLNATKSVYISFPKCAHKELSKYYQVGDI